MKYLVFYRDQDKVIWLYKTYKDKLLETKVSGSQNNILIKNLKFEEDIDTVTYSFKEFKEKYTKNEWKSFYIELKLTDTFINILPELYI